MIARVARRATPHQGEERYYEIDDEVVRATAAGYAAPGLRLLDAIHLATAQAGFGEALTAFVHL